MVLLASSMASASVENLVATMTGPKICMVSACWAVLQGGTEQGEGELGQWRSGGSCSREHEIRVEVVDSETYLFLHHLHLRICIRQYSRFHPVPAIALRPFLTARH